MLAVPDSNAYQERVFSFCTRFDDAQRRNLKQPKLEMQSLLKINRPSLDEVKKDRKMVEENKKSTESEMKTKSVEFLLDRGSKTRRKPKTSLRKCMGKIEQSARL
jgi:hypothetical protein